MKFVADLDANGVYWGVKGIPDEELTNDHVEVPEDCDLTSGAYIWSGGTFVPMQKKRVFATPEQITSDHCMYEMIKYLRDEAAANGKEIPAYCSIWASAYEDKLMRGAK